MITAHRECISLQYVLKAESSCWENDCLYNKIRSKATADFRLFPEFKQLNQRDF